ncbi:MAG: hypothetical protein K9J12_12870 [Melioribacteraceae bacterium]|nr:hypothetical protein [Melioribacteraceae bacterium]MCF8264080.1 hypothetical protein [Melioribacteraceae bacterium]MCF8413298.1 hypothetical protein [Melioribacteraceae bacterium]MCF8430849.1 hypothetical protein [Melioribacteraceae bacterium]
MKTRATLLVVSVMLVTFLYSSTYGQNYQLTNNQIESLKLGISSNNKGLMESSVYFAGKYRIKDVLGDLESLLYSKVNLSTKKLVMNSMYLIDESKTAKIAMDLYNSSNENKLKKFCYSLLAHHFQEDSYGFVKSFDR